MSGLFELDGVGVRYGEQYVLRDVTLRFDAPDMVALVGPNGAGKSTLLSVMSGLRRGYVGSCRYQGREMTAWQRRPFAREVSIVPQSLKLDFPFTAEQVALMGRTPHAGGMFETDADREAVESALRMTDSWEFRSRDFRSLSGGERQRVVLAAALAQEPRVLLLDEPTTFLDLGHQLAIYRLLRQLAGGGMLVIAVTHDLNLAATFSQRVVALKHGRVMADGTPAEALSPERITEIFDVETQRLPRADGRQWIAYGE